MRIAVVTTTRAEWHLLRPLVSELVSRTDCTPIVLAGGAHLLEEHGLTIREVEAHAACKVVPVKFGSRQNNAPDTGPQRDYLAMAQMMGDALGAFADALHVAAPDIVVVLGDRFEIMSAGLAAVALRIPLAHIEGGHVTEGAIDERFRHALTKLADVHYVALPILAARVRALGESADRIVVIGPTGATLAKAAPATPRSDIIRLTGLDPARAPIALATFHAETATDISARDIVSTVKAIVAQLTANSEPPVQFLFTAANLDPGGDEINDGLRALAAVHSERMSFVPSLGSAYWGVLKSVAVVVGNSSSGITETSALGIPTINIGLRQHGRDRYGPVVDLPWDARLIAGTISELAALARTHTGGDATATAPSLPQVRAPWRITAEHLLSLDLSRLGVKPFHMRVDA